MDFRSLYLLLKILPAAAILFWVVLTFLKKDVNKSQLLMLAGMIVAVFTIVDRETSVLFVYPLFFLAIRELTVRGGIPKWDYLIFLPSLILTALNNQSATDIYLCIQMAAFSVWAIIEVSRYNKVVAEFFDTENDSADLLNQILLYLIATIVVLVMLAFLPDRILSIVPVAAVLSLFVTLMQYLLGQSVYKLGVLPKIPEEIAKPIPAAPEFKEVSAPVEVSPVKPEIATTESGPDRKMIERVIKDELFLDPTISLVSMAEKLHTNRTYLSNSIHNCYDQNFSDFINHRRIEYAVQLMREEGNGTNIKDIALRSGYSHLQSFYRNFEQIMDMTPKMWMASNRKAE